MKGGIWNLGGGHDPEFRKCARHIFLKIPRLSEDKGLLSLEKVLMGWGCQHVVFSGHI